MDNLSRRTKIWLGIASIWPIVYFALFIAGFVCIGMFAPMTVPAGHTGHPSAPIAIIAMVLVFFVILPVLTSVLAMRLIAFYRKHIVNTERLTQDQKMLWGILIRLGGVVALPIYWYRYIWREPIPLTGTADSSGAIWQKARVPMGAAMLYAAVWFAIVIAYINSGMWPPHGRDEFRTAMPLFMVAIVFHWLAVMCVGGVIELCLAHAKGNNRLSNKSKIVWRVVLFALNILAIPVYWYLYIWQTPGQTSSLDTA